jgi:type IV pilus assembly protein PilA
MKLFKRIQEKKGFTLAELLIVVAIIAVLVAIAIPVFTVQLEKSREAADKANLRSAYAEQMTNILTWDGTSTIAGIDVTAKQTQANWQSDNDAASITIADGISNAGITVNQSTTGWTVGVDTTTDTKAPKVTITAK